MALLEHVPPCKSSHSLEENLALIDSRIQYLDELKIDDSVAEDNQESKRMEGIGEAEGVSTSRGYSIVYHEHQGLLFLFGLKVI